MREILGTERFLFAKSGPDFGFFDKIERPWHRGEQFLERILGWPWQAGASADGMRWNARLAAKKLQPVGRSKIGPNQATACGPMAAAKQWQKTSNQVKSSGGASVSGHSVAGDRSVSLAEIPLPPRGKASNVFFD